MGIGLAIGVVIDFGSVIGQAEAAGGGETSSGGGGGDGILSDIADSVGGIVEKGMIQVPLKNIPKAIKVLSNLPLFVPSIAMAADKAGGEKAWYQNVAFYIGPIIDVGFIFFTVGACLGGFGCAAGGGGLKFGNFGVGVLFPFWKWW